MDKPIKLMVTGDLHLGIHPSGIPKNIDSDSFSPGYIWKSIADEACHLSVDAVVITGDVIDRANQFYEAWGPFESGLRQLEAEAIPVFAVAGNHDSDVLGTFVDSQEAPNCQLIGRGGDWQRVAVERDGETVLQLDGWSYPERHIHENPMDHYDLPEPDRPTLGVLHTDFNNPGSRYAPVGEEDLKGTSLDGWLLGHIHKPQVHSERPLILNPGSPQPLDPTETGVHGPWEITVHGKEDIDVRQRPMATLQYEYLKKNAGELERPEDLTGAIKEQAQEKLEHADPYNEKLEALSLRVTLTGETDFHERLEKHGRKLKESFRPRVDQVQLYVEQLINKTRPPLDLQSLAEGTSPVARLAELVYELEQRGPGAKDLNPGLRDQTDKALAEAYNASTYEPLRVHGDVDQPNLDRAVELLRRQGHKLLRELYAQKEGGDE